MKVHARAPVPQAVKEAQWVLLVEITVLLHVVQAVLLHVLVLLKALVAGRAHMVVVPCVPLTVKVHVLTHVQAHALMHAPVVREVADMVVQAHVLEIVLVLVLQDAQAVVAAVALEVAKRLLPLPVFPVRKHV